MNRHAKPLQSKSRAHQVILVNPTTNHYQVTSGTSGITYDVNLFADGKGGCTCDWGKYRPEGNRGASGCSHVIAAIAYSSTNRSVYVWSTSADAQSGRKMCSRRSVTG